ncbi:MULTISPECIES: toll/interleukin-1 receptor domain-containing protein [Niastella]|uniref:Toll/interleukin-1 receptor domain-containing protein n=1 Tax=Niastella soli TaxID=2821487 RepID=A0ABS3YYQ8_9BACT|nr:toll/interleukin-1 receptor domain-containing protein [Niastella soli]MBO9203057.1 toll/interleukin-1 receptor domain-containing protein [Niastella soli]
MEPISNHPLWDFFIAHSHVDKQTALEIYEVLHGVNYKVFLDQKSILPGASWDLAIPDAQKRSLITIVLISGNIRQSHFVREEVQTAIALWRTDPNSHCIIPVFLNGIIDDLPYGLRLLQGIDLKNSGSVTNLANKLIECLVHFKSVEPIVPDYQIEKQHILLSFPAGPLVPFHMIPRVLIETYSAFIGENESKLVVSEANAFRLEASPDTNFIIPLYKILAPEKVAAFDFWQDVFLYAGLQGPRMVAAILLIVPDDQFSAKAKEARRKLLMQLKNHS